MLETLPEKYRRLTPLRQTTVTTKNRDIDVYVCLCDCGEMCMVEVSAFTSFKRNSCGCTRPNTKKKHHFVPGDRVEQLELISPIFLDAYSANLRFSQRQWLCRCDCGNYTVAEQNALKNGLRRGCGCQGRHARGTRDADNIHIGDKFGALTVRAELPHEDKGLTQGVFRRYFECVCECGRVESFTYTRLLSEVQQRCTFCYRQLQNQKLHKLKPDYPVEYQIWRGMIGRCHGRGASESEKRNYQRRGIVVCEEWRKSFDAFIQHIGPRPTPIHSVDRINNDGNYEPGNVRWATPTEQAHNQRTVPILQDRIYDLESEVAQLQAHITKLTSTIENQKT